MARLPFIQFFPNDWLAEPSLRACSLAARGLWMDMLSLMHLSPRRGYLLAASGSPITPEQLARLTGCSADDVTRLLAELQSSGVFNCTEDGTHTIYSRRMVRDESRRQKCAAAGRRGGGNPQLKIAEGGDCSAGITATFKGRPKGAPKGAPKGDSKLPESRGQSPETREPPLPPSGGVAGCDVLPFVPLADNPPPRASEIIDVNLWPEFVAAWTAAGLPGAGKVQRTPHRVGLLQQRLADATWRDGWREAIARAGRSGKCRGQDPKWAAGLRLDTFLKDPDFVTRILEGEFDDATAAEATTAPIARDPYEEFRAKHVRGSQKEDAA